MINMLICFWFYCESFRIPSSCKILGVGFSWYYGVATMVSTAGLWTFLLGWANVLLTWKMAQIMLQKLYALIGKCISKSVLVSDCSTCQCNMQGVCSNKDHCYRDDKWSPPNYKLYHDDKWGPPNYKLSVIGGSNDSGPSLVKANKIPPKKLPQINPS